MKPTRLQRRIAIVVACSLLLLSTCETSRERAVERAQRAATATDAIQVALVWPAPPHEPGFLAGAELAVTQINSQGGVLGRRLTTLLWQDGDTPAQARAVARNPHLIAVVGHQTSAAASAAALTYENNGMVYIAPAATDLSLTAHQFQYTFRTIPSNAHIVRRLVDFVARMGYRNIVSLSVRNSYGSEISRLFTRNAEARGLRLVHQRSFFTPVDKPQQIIAEFRHHHADVIFVAGSYEEVHSLMTLSRTIGVTLPYLLPTDLQAAGDGRVAEAPRGLIFFPVLWHAHAASAITQRFVATFRDTYGTSPDFWAVQGYDALYLLAQAMTRSASTVPKVLAATLRYDGPWDSVLGLRTFAPSGQMQGPTIAIGGLRDGTVIPLHERAHGAPMRLTSQGDSTARYAQRQAAPAVDGD